MTGELFGGGKKRSEAENLKELGFLNTKDTKSKKAFSCKIKVWQFLILLMLPV